MDDGPKSLGSQATFYLGDIAESVRAEPYVDSCVNATIAAHPRRENLQLHAEWLHRLDHTGQKSVLRILGPVHNVLLSTPRGQMSTVDGA